MIPQDDSVRLLSQLLDELDYRELVKAYSPLGRKAAVDPVNLFKVIVYGYHCGIYSSRAIEQSCRRDINFRWLLEGKRGPGKSTIAAFRAGKLGVVVEGLFYQLVERLYARGEVAFEHLFVDGTKIEANANRYSFVWKKSVDKQQKKQREKEQIQLATLNERYKRSFSSLETAVEQLNEEAKDIAFVSGKGKHKTQLQRDIEAIDALLEQKARYAEYQATFGGRNSFSKTDTDATFMRLKEDHMKNGHLKPAYNVQVGVEGEYIVGVDLSDQRSDTLTLIPLLQRMESRSAKRHETIVADAGYESEENYTYLAGMGQEAYIKPINYEQSQKRKFRNNPFLRENMPYDPDADCYTCPNGRRLNAAYTHIRKSKSGFESVVTAYQCEDCNGCTHRASCFQSKQPDANRTIDVAKTFLRQRTETYEKIVSPKGKLLRMNRSIQAEGVFAVIKQDYAFRRFLTRGKENVRTEMLLMAMGYNIFRLHCKIQSNRTKQLLFTKMVC